MNKHLQIRNKTRARPNLCGSGALSTVICVLSVGEQPISIVILLPQVGD